MASVQDIMVFKTKPKPEFARTPKPKTESERYFETQFTGVDKITKKELPNYTGKTSLYNTIFKINDKIMEIAILNAGDALTCRHLSITFKRITERDLKKLLKDYIIIKMTPKYPTLVERKYMEDKEYKDYKKIIERDYV